MNKHRAHVLSRIVKNYNQWPAKTDHPGGATHHGYRWCKPEANGLWTLRQGNEGDVITRGDYLKEYEDSVMMSDLFDVANYNDGSVGNPHKDDVTITFSAEQFRAMSVAIRYHDGMKAKLNHARNALRRLTTELGE